MLIRMIAATCAMAALFGAALAQSPEAKAPEAQAIDEASADAIASPPPRTDEFCTRYAEAAVRDFQLTHTRRECRAPQTPRWHDVLEAHYDWCVGVSRREATGEERARDRHLTICGERTY